MKFFSMVDIKKSAQNKLNSVKGKKKYYPLYAGKSKSVSMNRMSNYLRDPFPEPTTSKSRNCE